MSRHRLRVDGVLVDGHAAYMLSKVLGRDRIDAALHAKGYPPKWRGPALEAVDAIVEAGKDWGAAARADIERIRASEAGSVGGTSEPEPAENGAPFEAMEGTVSVTEAAGLKGCSQSYVRRLCRYGELPARKQGHGRGWLLDARAVADWCGAGSSALTRTEEER